MTEPGWVLSCDPGVDDAIALAVVAGRADCDVRAVVAGAGNVDAATAWRNAVGLAALLALDVPVGIGSSLALDGTPIHRAGHVHGVDGLAGLSPLLPAPAAQATDGGPLLRGAVLATGPLTDVARARRAGQRIERVVWMGGSLPGTATPTAEFNAGADPVAVNEVFGSVDDVRVVPLDVTAQVRLTAGDLALWEDGPASARLCGALARSRQGDGHAPLHDPVAVVAALEPHLFRWQWRRLRCSVATDPPRGALVVEHGAAGSAGVRVAVAVDAPAVRDRIVRAVLRQHDQQRD